MSPRDPPALATWKDAAARGARAWSELFDPTVFNEEAVRELLVATGYPEEQLRFVSGPVEETLPGAAPEELALLRLDTDWYESTRHELEHLYPRLTAGGVVIIDDYGHEDRRIEGWHRRRLDLRPGITGPWQVLGSSRIPVSEMARLDYRVHRRLVGVERRPHPVADRPAGSPQACL